MNVQTGDVVARNRPVLFLALVTAAILLVPLVATRLSDEVTWTLADFVVMGGLVFGAGLAFIVAARRVTRYRALIGAALLGGLIFVWAELAVGVFTDLGS